MEQRFWIVVGIAVIMATLLFTTWRSSIMTNLMHVVASHAIFRLDSPSDVIPNLPFYSWFLPQSTLDYMWEAEAYSAYQTWGKAQAAYQNYRELGGDSKLALRRLVKIASLRSWCLTDHQALLSLAMILTSKADAYQVLGDACTFNLQPNAAIDAYRQSFGISPNYVIAGKLAWMLFQRAEAAKVGAPDDRLADFSEIVHVLKSVPLQPSDSRNHYLLAWSYWQLNQFDEALVAYEACLTMPQKKDRDAFVCALNLGHAYSAWLPASRWDRSKAEFYYQQAELLAYDDVSRLEAQNALQGLEGIKQ